MGSKRSVRKRTVPGCVAIGAAAGLIVCVILSGIVAFLIWRGSVSEGRGEVIAPIVLLLSTGIGCIVSSKMAGERIAVVCIATGCVFALVLAGAALFFFGGKFSGLLVKVLSVLLGCGVACMLGARKEKKRTSR